MKINSRMAHRSFSQFLIFTSHKSFQGNLSPFFVNHSSFFCINILRFKSLGHAVVFCSFSGFWLGAFETFTSKRNFFGFFTHAFIGFVKIVQMLVEKGAEVNVVSRDGFSVLDAASKATKGSNFNFLWKNCTNFFKNHHQKECYELHIYANEMFYHSVFQNWFKKASTAKIHHEKICINELLNDFYQFRCFLVSFSVSAPNRNLQLRRPRRIDTFINSTWSRVCR